MRRWLIGLIVFCLAVAGAFWVSPLPGVYIIRALFDHGARTASDKLAPLLPDNVQTVTRNYDASDPTAVLDVYRAPGTPADAATVVWVHGGGFVSGRRQDLENYLRILAARGVTVVNVDYTIAPEATYPTPIRQVSAALAFLLKEGGSLGVNPRRFVLAGDSAGAQIAAQTAAVTVNPDYAATIGVHPKLPPEDLAGVVLFCGVYDISRMGTSGGLLGWFVQTTAWAYSGERDWRGSADFATINFIPSLTAAYPPAFLSAGNADPLGPQSVELAGALGRAGVPTETLFFPAGHTPGLPHEYQFDLTTDAGKLSLDRLTSWLQRLR